MIFFLLLLLLFIYLFLYLFFGGRVHNNMYAFHCNFIEIALRRGCSPVNLLHIFRTPFPKNTSKWLLLKRKRFVKYSLSFLAEFYKVYMQ